MNARFLVIACIVLFFRSREPALHYIFFAAVSTSFRPSQKRMPFRSGLKMLFFEILFIIDQKNFFCLRKNRDEISLAVLSFSVN